MQILQSEVFTPRSLVPRTEKQRYLDLLSQISDQLIPERFGFWEPLQTRFAREAINQATDDWRSSLFCTRKRPRVDIDALSAWGGPAPIHGGFVIRAESGKRLFPGVLSFNHQLASEFQADLAFVHALAREEIPIGIASESVSVDSPRRDTYDILFSTHELRRFLPQLYWGTLFGPAYVELFGEERLLSAPAKYVRKLDYGAIYVQLSDSPYDFIDDYPHMEAIRQRVKEHLGKNAFFDPDLPRSHKYDVPIFNLDSEKYRQYPENP
jgi:hypothetical protein